MRGLLSEKLDDYEVMSDGRVVWLNHRDLGCCVARFSPTGQEIRPLQPSVDVAVRHPPEGPSLDDWKLFLKRASDSFGVEVAEKHRPLYLMPN